MSEHRLHVFDEAHCRSLPKFERSVSLLCWAYNEEALVESFLIRITTLLRRSVEHFEIVFVDDCSTDRTFHIVQRLAGRDIPEIRLLRNERNLNVGLSSRRAISEARMEFLFWQTIDWSYDIRLLRGFLELLRDYDVVAGVRRDPVEARGVLARVASFVQKLFGVKHLTRRSDTVPKALVSVINYTLIRILFQVPLSDYQNVCFYRTSLIQAFEFEARSSFTNPEGLLKSYWSGARIAEVPISFLARDRGVAKGTKLRAIISSTHDVFRLWFKWIVLGTLDRDRCGEIRRLCAADWPPRIGG